jgi:DNA-binding NtrC family response regulator
MKTIVLTIDFDPSIETFKQIRYKISDEFERQFTNYMLERHKDNLSAASKEVKMDRKHLYDLANKHGLRQKKSRKS